MIVTIGNRDSMNYPDIFGKNLHRTVKALGCVCLTVLSAGLQAQDFEGQSFKLGETDLTPEVRIDYVSLDNTYRTPNDPVASTGLVVSPAVNWQADRRLLSLRATYVGEFGAFSESILNYADHSLTARIDASPGTRHRTFAAFTFSQEHEAIGTGQSELDPNLPDQIVASNVILASGYTFGAPSARGNVGAGLTLGSQTFNDVGILTRGDDNSELKPSVFFSYRLSPDTRFRAELSYSILDYEEDRRDRSELAFTTGLDLAATSRTGGRLRFGVSNAAYETAGISDRSQFIANVNLYYRPRTYTRFDLVFTRDLDTVATDATGAGESLVDKASLGWRHNWSSRFSTNLRTELQQVDRECPNIDTATRTIGLSFAVKIRRWVSVGAGVANTQRTATLCNEFLDPDSADYDRTALSVSLSATL